MYSRIADFIGAYKHETDCTQRVLGALTEASFATEKTPGDTSVKDLAWHIATAGAHMLNHEGAGLEDGGWQTPADLTPAGIADKHKAISAGVAEFCEGKLSDADLTRDATWFGFTLPLGVWLNMIVNHEVHHRGQLSVLMRQAGLTVPSIYGPNKEETAEMMAKMAAGGAAG